jgi:8-amino-7-oxononanoate synthase
MSWDAWVAGECGAIRAAQRWRELLVFDAAGPVGTLAGREVVSFASNDYLGLTRHPAVLAAAHDALDRWGTGSGAARLVVGSRPVHRELEAEVAVWRRSEAALLFPTGYAANLGVLTTFGGPGVRICSDERNHASIIDGSRLARADVAVYRHGDVDHLDALLAEAQRAVVVTETVFSMDGDVAPVADLVECCCRRGALLVLDEAHAVLGPDPDLGAVEALRVGTLSKALGAVGGFVAGPRAFVDLLVNRARPFIFTTAPTPADTAAALVALGVVCSPEGDVLRARLRELVARVTAGHPSPIVPIVVGDEQAALAASDVLLARGLLVPAIRPPSVPAGTSRLRVALSAAHTDAQVALLVSALAELTPSGTAPAGLGPRLGEEGGIGAPPGEKSTAEVGDPRGEKARRQGEPVGH